ncbi:class I SAM-dependent methyltransferase [Nocardia takedensis]
MNLARLSMNAPVVAAIYEKAWRPAIFYLATGRTTAADRRYAAAALRLGGEQRVLDLACGPGNFTRFLGERLSGGGYAVGVDYSEPMLARAVVDNTGPRVGYLRGDARELPFADASFDAVACFGALYLIPDPLAATAEMVRVLAPGGRIAITTSHHADNLVGHASRLGGGLLGLRVFDEHTFPDLFAELGLVEIEQRVHRTFQYLSATRPR